MLWAKNNNLTIAIQNLSKDVASANGNLRLVYEETAAETAAFLVDTQTLINSKSGALLHALKHSYVVNWPVSVNLADVDLLDQQLGPYKLSSENAANPHYSYKVQGGKLNVQSYWPFVLFGWSGEGGKGGGRGYHYKLVAHYHNPLTGEYTALSPYHPSILSGEIRPTSYTRHPGAKARNIFVTYFGATQSFFNKTLNRKLLMYFAKYGIKR